MGRAQPCSVCSPGSPRGLRAAQALAVKLERGALEDGFTLRDVRRNQWRSLTTDDAIQAALDWLEDEDWLRDVANEMDIEDGVIWVYGLGDDGVQAFTDFGIENLIEEPLSEKLLRGEFTGKDTITVKMT